MSYCFCNFGLEDSYLSYLKPVKRSMSSLGPVLLFSKGCQSSRFNLFSRQVLKHCKESNFLTDLWSGLNFLSAIEVQCCPLMSHSQRTELILDNYVIKNKIRLRFDEQEHKCCCGMLYIFLEDVFSSLSG